MEKNNSRVFAQQVLGICTIYIHMYKEMRTMLVTITYLGNMCMKVQIRIHLPKPMFPIYWGYHPFFFSPMCCENIPMVTTGSQPCLVSQFSIIHTHFKFNMTYIHRQTISSWLRDQLYIGFPFIPLVLPYAFKMQTGATLYMFEMFRELSWKRVANWHKNCFSIQCSKVES